MARNYRFFVGNPQIISQLEKTERLRIENADEPDMLYQLNIVLRGRNGDKVALLPKMEKPVGDVIFEYSYLIDKISKKELELVFQEKFQNNNEPAIELQLILCLPNKPDKLEFILQKAVELGAAAITLVEADFSQMKHGLREERLKKIMIEAAEQSERGYVPQLIFDKGLLRDFLEKAGNPENEGRAADETLLVAMERKHTAKNSLQNILTEQAGLLRDLKKIKILIGPEGGFSGEEKKAIKELGLQWFSLGKMVLRMETAAVLSLGMVALVISAEDK